MAKKSAYKGFTLIEILIVVALIAILATITIVAINPAKNFADTRDAQRSADVSEILNGVSQYLIEVEEGHTLADFGAVPTCPTTANIGTGVGNISLALLVDEYMVAIPFDPSTGDDADTGYDICQTAGGRVQISAVGENDPVISVQR